MGGCTFEDRGTGKTAADAFERIVKEARYEHGHGGYSGTIAEKTEFKMVDGGALSRAEAHAKARALTDADDPRYCDKWGPAGCIELKEDAGGQPIAPNGRVEKLPKGHKAFLFFGWASS